MRSTQHQDLYCQASDHTRIQVSLGRSRIRFSPADPKSPRAVADLNYERFFDDASMFRDSDHPNDRGRSKLTRQLTDDLLRYMGDRHDD